MSALSILVCPARKLVHLVQCEKPQAVFSFNVPPVNEETALYVSPVLAEELEDEGWRRKQLFFKAFDVEYRRKETIDERTLVLAPPGRKLLRRAFAHLDEMVPPGQAGSIIVNCWAGKSRSPALALALMAYRQPQASSGFLVNELMGRLTAAMPNRAIVAHADEMLGRKDSLLEAVDFHPFVIENRAQLDRDPVRQNGFMAALVKRGFSL